MDTKKDARWNAFGIGIWHPQKVTIYIGLCIFLATISVQDLVGRAWTVADSIQTRYYYYSTSEGILWGAGSAKPEVFFSPNRHWAFVVSHIGDPVKDVNRYEMTVFNVDDVRRELMREGGPGPTSERRTIHVVRETSSNRVPGIAHPTWLPDSSGISFLAPIGKGCAMHVLSLETKEVQVVSPGDWFEPDRTPASYRNGSIVVSAQAAPHAVDAPYPYYMPIMRGDGGYSWDQSALQMPRSYLWVSYQGQPYRRVEGGSWGKTISADGRWAALHGNGFTRGSRFRFLDIKNATVASIFHYFAPEIKTPGALLLADCSLQWGSRMPFALMTGANIAPRGGPAAAGIALVDPETGDLRVVCPMVQSITNEHGEDSFGVTRAAWNDDDREIVVDFANAEGRRVRRKWNVSSTGLITPSVTIPQYVADTDKKADQVMEIFFRESPTEPPSLVASIRGREITLIASDRHLSEVLIEKSKVVAWEENGRVVHGQFVKPSVSLRPGKIPLVIQIYHNKSDHFRPDGAHATADATQLLAAQGIAVLMVDLSPAAGGDPDEGPGIVRRLEAAVTRLAQEENIDVTKVGLSGFSRGGYQTLYSITHPGKFTWAAAICADSFVGSFSDYAQRDSKGGKPVANFWERRMGGAFWGAQGNWLREEPIFNAHRVRTPVLFTTNNSENLSYPNFTIAMNSIETLGALRLCNKPVEYLLFPNSAHQLHRPSEREAMLRVVVNWFSFWLNDRIPDDERFVTRWSELRKQQEEVLRTAPPPRSNWVFVPDEKDHASANELKN